MDDGDLGKSTKPSRASVGSVGLERTFTSNSAYAASARNTSAYLTSADLLLMDGVNMRRYHAARFMEARTVEYGIIFLVFAFMLIVFAQMVATDEDGKTTLDDTATTVLTVADLSILVVFFFEISIKIYAYGYLVYLVSPLYFLDACFVVLSITLSVIDLMANNDFLDRFSNMRAVLRLLRIIIMFRKVSTAADNSRKLTGLGYNLDTPAQEVVELLRPLSEYERLPRVQREDIKWAITIIDSGRLYQPVPEGNSGNDAASAWLASGVAEQAQTSPFVDTGRHRKSGTPFDLSTSQDVDEPWASAGFRLKPFCEQVSADMDIPRAKHELKKLQDWHFDVVRLDRVTDHNALRVLTALVGKWWNFFDLLEIEEECFHDFMERIQSGYFASNRYHNSVHAADVFQSCLWMMTTGGLAELAKFNDEQFFASLFAAAVHDFEHPGINNVFCVKTGHRLAIRYNDTAVLEMHHVAASYAVLHSSARFNFMKGMSDVRYAAVREAAVAIVLATDMSKHFEELSKLKSRVASGGFLNLDGQSKDDTFRQDQMLALKLSVHACDIANPAKPLQLYVYWTERVLMEYFAQGDKERELGLPISMLMDRKTTNIAKCQVGFIDILVFPLFDELRNVLEPFRQCCGHIVKNKKFWQDKIDDMEEEMIKGTQRVPTVGRHQQAAEQEQDLQAIADDEGDDDVELESGLAADKKWDVEADDEPIRPKAVPPPVVPSPFFR
mmetsp:Transcript_31291/g.74962  ORF Transcript_31291/g.74962 Transcript_31291/m.74962 type:complete len:726 (-) Transcript_31291:216-2393(-)